MHFNDVQILCSRSRNAGINQHLEMILGVETDQEIHFPDPDPDTNVHWCHLSHVTPGISLVIRTQISMDVLPMDVAEKWLQSILFLTLTLISLSCAPGLR